MTIFKFNYNLLFLTEGWKKSKQGFCELQIVYALHE